MGQESFNLGSGWQFVDGISLDGNSLLMAALLLVGGCAAILIAVNTWWQRKYARIVADLFDKEATLAPRREPADLSATQWTVATPDRVELSVSLLKNQLGSEDAPIVIFCHEYGSDGWSARHYCAGLLEAGFDVLTFDFGSHGDSQSREGYRPCIWLTEYELIDVRTVVRFAYARSDLRGRVAGIMGASRGAGAALAIAAEDKRLPAVFVEAAYSTRLLTNFFVQRWMRLELSTFEYHLLPYWHILWTVQKGRRLLEQRRGCHIVDLEVNIETLADRALRVVSGSRDSYVPLEIVTELVQAAGHDETAIWRVDRAKHNQARDVAPSEFDRRCIDFFSAIAEPAGLTASLRITQSAG